ncbi:MAG TPA: amino acid adenylation domain-containing protein, partial [Mycobacteriales bacterium]|nr:amino acid adenylation domain-containing protein [Mycobacteriales bacterium]
AWSVRVRRLHEQVGRDLDHRDTSAVWVLREMARADGADAARMPVVFTSALGVEDTLSNRIRRPVWSVAQTPQVCLDQQVMERAGGLSLTWDVVEDLYPPGVIDAMFSAQQRLLDWASGSDWSGSPPDPLPAEQRAVRLAVNDTAGPVPQGTLHGEFFRHARADPARVALAWGSAGRMSYGELADQALRIATALRRRGVTAGDPVAVSLPKRPGQIAAVLGVLAAGGVYVPVGVDQPPVRRERILATAGTRLVLTAGSHPERGTVGGESVALPDALSCPPASAPLPVEPDALAYVIFTSGSTGEPKGVEVTHRSAANTVHDVNARFGVGPTDRVLAVSALDFDLSVYDIFGMLTAGAALVLLDDDERADPGRWLDLAGRHRVSIWNSVPALLDMLLDAAADRRLPTLRLALVSGDRVGLDLAPRLAAWSPETRLVALGGATEAAIWSNHYRVTGVPEHGTSVPYGFPLGNQRYRVVDAEGRDRPDWAAGELWIGGLGVARGYRGDAEQTRRRFVQAGGERWYRTGDIGRYWPDGTLEFLGRADQQVKIRGHRVELGEIEAALASHPDVRAAVAVVAPDVGQPVTFVVPAGCPPDPGALAAFLAERLPSYAVPIRYHIVEDLPLTANGKVDRPRLVSLARPQSPIGTAHSGPRGDTERVLAGLWADLLGVDDVPRDASFFALGGDSLLAARLTSRIRDRLGADVALRTLFAAPTVAELAPLIEPRTGTGDSDDLEEGIL